MQAQGRLIEERRIGYLCPTGCPSLDTWDLGVVELRMQTTNYHGSTTGHGPVRLRRKGCCDSGLELYGTRNGGPGIMVLRKSPSTSALVLSTETVHGVVAEGPWVIEL